MIGAVALALPHAAVAQDADGSAASANASSKTSTVANPAASAAVEGEMLVTAQKRTENVMNVPLSVSVLDSSQLESNHVVDYADLSREVPSLSFTNTGNASTSRIALRGIASSSGSATVGIYLDDIALSFPNQFFTGATLPQLFDIDRIEVLRGPQGTLYGDSSLGGTLRFITNKPQLGVSDGYVSSEVSTTAGGGMNYEVSGAVSAPISDKAAIRIAAETGHESGFVDRVDSSGNVVQSDIDSGRNHALRATVLWEPTPDLKITPSIQYQYSKTSDNDIFDLSLPKIQTDKQVSEPSRDEMYAPSLTIEKSFGDYNLTSISSFMQRTYERDLDATIYDSEYVASAIDSGYGSTYDSIAGLPGVLHNKDKISNVTQEVRFASPSIADGHKFEWQVGVYLNSLTAKSDDDEYVYGLGQTVDALYPGQTVEDLIGYDAPGDLLGYFHSKRKLDQVAIFAEGSVMLTSALKFTAGIRQVKAWTEYEMNEGGWLADGTPSYEKVKSSETPTTPKFALNYALSEDLSLYASAAKGFRLGGQNNSLPSYCGSAIAALGLSADGSKSFKSDSLWSYETGFKSRLFGNRLRVNGSIYRIDWKDIQQQLRLSSCGYVITANAGDATSTGGELEIVGQLTDELTLRVSGGYTDAKITKEADGSSAKEGQKVLGVPDSTLTIGLDYNRPISDSAVLFASTSWAYTGKSYGSFDTSNSDYHRPDYWVGNLDAGIDYEDIRVSLFAKNILNDQTVIQQPSVLFVRQGLTIRPRTIGISINKTF